MGRKPKKENYFTQETEDAIVLYNSTTDKNHRAEIFSSKIYYPFYKLAENIIHTFKFYYTDVDDIEDLKHKIITLLLEEKIHKFDPSVGSKAYSYFGTIVKRWLINYNNKNYKNLKRRGSLDEYEAELEFQDEVHPPDVMSLSEFVDYFVDNTYGKLNTLFPKESDKKIADAILTIFKSRKDIQLFKKKALYIYIREISNCSTPNLTQVISILKEEFYKEYMNKIERGTLQTV
jgi:hypothetical protein